jgi:hypothetical protein
MASVKENGKFSSFPGYDRSIAIIGGEGLLIRVGSSPGSKWIPIERTSSPFPFSGDEETEAQLLRSEVSDFNVFTRRESYSHHLSRHLLPPNNLSNNLLNLISSSYPLERFPTLLLGPLGGCLDIRINQGKKKEGLEQQQIDAVTLEDGDSCVIDAYDANRHEVQLTSHTNPVELFVVALQSK